MKSQLTTSSTVLWFLKNSFFPHIKLVISSQKLAKNDKTLQRCLELTNHCTRAVMLKPLPASVCWRDRMRIHNKGKESLSKYICLISASTRRTTEGGAGFISKAVAARLAAQLAWQPSGVIDDTNSKSYEAFVLRRSLKCLYSPEIRERSIMKTEAAVALQPFEKARGF